MAPAAMGRASMARPGAPRNSVPRRCTIPAPSAAPSLLRPPTTAPIGSISVLELDDDLEVGLVADVSCRLHAPAGHEDGRARDDIGGHVLAVGALGVRLGIHGDAVARHLDEDVVELVPVD